MDEAETREMIAELVRTLGGVLTRIPLYLFEQDDGTLQEAVDVYQRANGLKKNVDRARSRFF